MTNVYTHITNTTEDNMFTYCWNHNKNLDYHRKLIWTVSN